MSETEVEFNWDDPFAAEKAQPEEPETPAAETTPDDGRARDDKGRFLPKTEEAPEPEEVKLLAGKYKTPDQLEQAYLEAQQLLGTLRNDQGELRSQLEQLTTAVQQQAQPRNVQDFEAMLETDPQQASLYALTVGDQAAYERAKQHWNELAPGAPAIWEQNLRLQQEVTELKAQFTGLEAPVAEQRNLRVVADAYREIQNQNQDFADLQPFMGEIIDGIASDGYDWVTPALESGDRKQIASALNTVLLLARARSSGNLQDQARAAAQEHVAATEQAKREAIVGHATTSMSDPPDKTPGQKIAESWAAYDISALRDA